ncbi:hypothetical protein [Latilactobacillus sakei]|uniref:hypothetical protein n=1 Tax=Latilactobacillus sakei TaxID=1599 RepID=UPI003F539DC1
MPIFTLILKANAFDAALSIETCFLKLMLVLSTVLQINAAGVYFQHQANAQRRTALNLAQTCFIDLPFPVNYNMRMMEKIPSCPFLR